MLLKRLLIVDDSEIDRIILRNILSRQFNITEVNNGYDAMEKMMDPSLPIDAVLLDISMPILDGFGVLRLIEENNIDLPVILITADATKINVEKAAQYNITGFIKKPYDSRLILNRICSLLYGSEKVEEEEKTEEPDFASNLEYAERLERLFQTYLTNHERTDDMYARSREVAALLLKSQAKLSDSGDNDEDKITLAAKAVYLRDIGCMCIPSEVIPDAGSGCEENFLYEEHTLFGSDIVHLNMSESCNYFVNLCSEICLHHHEKADGSGYPHGLQAESITFYSRLCSVVCQFDELFIKRPAFDHNQYVFILNEMALAKEFMDKKMLELFYDCEEDVLAYYNKFFSKEKI